MDLSAPDPFSAARHGIRRDAAKLWEALSDSEAQVEIRCANLKLSGTAPEEQEASQELQAIFAEGQRLVTGLRKLIKNHYGISSEKLAEFDIQPYRGRKRKVAPVEIPEIPEGPSPE